MAEQVKTRAVAWPNLDWLRDVFTQARKVGVTLMWLGAYHQSLSKHS